MIKKIWILAFVVRTTIRFLKPATPEPAVKKFYPDRVSNREAGRGFCQPFLIFLPAASRSTSQRFSPFLINFYFLRKSRLKWTVLNRQLYKTFSLEQFDRGFAMILEP